MKNIISFLIFVLSWSLGFSQNCIKDYKDELRGIDNMRSYFEYYHDYSNSEYIEYLKGIEGDLIDTIYYYEVREESGFVIEYEDSDSITYKIGIWTKKRKGGSIISYSFYIPRSELTGPIWFYRRDGSISEKQWWHQTQKAKLKKKFSPILYYEFYSKRFYRNGKLKREGDFNKDVKDGLWKYYNKSGLLTKEKNH